MFTNCATILLLSGIEPLARLAMNNKDNGIASTVLANLLLSGS